MAVIKTADKINKALGVDDPKHISTGKRGIKNKLTEQTIKAVLKDGTPDWYTRPEDYKDMAKDEYARQKQASDAQVREYRLPDQEIYTDEAPRRTGVLTTKQFLGKLRDNGLACCAQQNKNSPENTAGLFVIVPGREQLGLKFVTSVQVPAMYEWSVLREDEHGLPNGEKFIGWRNACVKLVELDIWSEDKMHKVFGRPPDRAYTKTYYKSLWLVRNRYDTKNVGL